MMAFAAVVRRVETTNEMSVTAYAAATGAMRQLQPRRASGRTANRNGAATAARKPATCHAVIGPDLMAAPPVENRKALPPSRAWQRPQDPCPQGPHPR